MSIYNLELNQPQAAEAAGVTPKDIQNWVSRKMVIGHREDDITGGGTKGKSRMFSFRSVMNFAIAKELLKHGVATAEALRAAADFAHVSGGGNIFGLPDREPGLPFHYNLGATVFAVGLNRTWEDLWKPGENYDTYGKIRHVVGSSFIAIDASGVFDQVCARLMLLTGRREFHPNAILDAAYPQDAKA